MAQRAVDETVPRVQLTFLHPFHQKEPLSCPTDNEKYTFNLWNVAEDKPRSPSAVAW